MWWAEPPLRSAIQIVPEIAPRVRTLHLFQRTPPWVLPKEDRAISERERWLYKSLPLAQWLHRQVIYWRLESRVPFTALWPGSTLGFRWLTRRLALADYHVGKTGPSRERPGL